jgi:hypothetical protein
MSMGGGPVARVICGVSLPSAGGAWTILATRWLLRTRTSAPSVGRRQRLAGGDITGHIDQPPGG